MHNNLIQIWNYGESQQIPNTNNTFHSTLCLPAAQILKKTLKTQG